MEIKPGVRFQGCCWVATLGGGGVRRSEAEGVRGDGRQVRDQKTRGEARQAKRETEETEGGC